MKVSSVESWSLFFFSELFLACGISGTNTVNARCNCFFLIRLNASESLWPLSQHSTVHVFQRCQHEPPKHEVIPTHPLFPNYFGYRQLGYVGTPSCALPSTPPLVPPSKISIFLLSESTVCSWHFPWIYLQSK